MKYLIHHNTVSTYNSILYILNKKIHLRILCMCISLYVYHLNQKLNFILLNFT